MTKEEDIFCETKTHKEPLKMLFFYDYPAPLALFHNASVVMPRIMFCVPFIKETSFPSSQWVGKSQLLDRLDNWLYCQHKQTEPSVMHIMGCYSILTFQIPSSASLQLLRYHWSPWKSARSPRLRTKSTGQWIIYGGKQLHKEDRERNWGPQHSGHSQVSTHLLFVQKTLLQHAIN